MLVILILSFSLVLQVIHPFINETDRTDISFVYNSLCTSNSEPYQYIYDWNRTWGGVDWDVGHGITMDSSDNLYLVGETESFGEYGSDDMALIKYDERGVQQWNRTWGAGGYELANGVAVDLSNNIYVVGRTSSFGAGYDDIILVKYDNEGIQQWNCTWGGTGYEYGNGVIVDSSDKVYIVGDSYGFGAGGFDIVLVKYDNAGIQQWNCTWGGIDDDVGYGVALDSLDNVYVVGSTDSFGVEVRDIILIKYDSNGVQQWNRTWGGIDYDEGYGVTVDSSDNVYLIGETFSFGAGINDMILVKYDSAGTQQWNCTWGGSWTEIGQGVTADSLGNVYISGYTSSFGAGSADIVVVEYNGNGVQQWNRTWGGTGFDYGYGVTNI
jgi:hypothetical protein